MWAEPVLRRIYIILKKHAILQAARPPSEVGLPFLIQLASAPEHAAGRAQSPAGKAFFAETGFQSFPENGRAGPDEIQK